MALQKIIEYAEYIPTIIFGLLFTMSFYYIFLKDISLSYLAGQLSETEEKYYATDRMLNQAGIRLNTMQVRAALFTLAFVLAVIALFYAIYYKRLGFFLLGILFDVLILTLFSPSEEFATGIKSPFVLITKKVRESRGKSLDDEIFNGCITLKNLAIVKQESPMSADVMFEQLMENSNKLKPIYAEMLSIYRSGDSEKAFRQFGDSIGTKYGKSYAALLSRVDRINPYELKDQVAVLQEAMSEKRLTRRMKKAEQNGVITISLATATFFLLVLDFAFVVVMLPALHSIGNIFG